METNIPTPGDPSPNIDDLLVIDPEPDAEPYPLRRRRMVSLLVTIGWVIFISALCAYVLMK